MSEKVNKQSKWSLNQVQDDVDHLTRHVEFISTSTGRSMVEMLGVLAIIGMLSLTALGGYRMAITYYRANETMSDVMLRATNVQTRENFANFTGTEFTFPDMGDYKTKNTLGYEVHTYPEAEGSEYAFRVEVSSVPSEVCKRINNMNPTAVDEIEPVANSCGDTTTTMKFYFGDKLGGVLPGPSPEPTPTECTTPCGECQTCVNGSCQNKTDGTICSSGCCQNGSCGSCECSPPCPECKTCVNGQCENAAVGTACSDGGSCNASGICCQNKTYADCQEECKELIDSNGCTSCSANTICTEPKTMCSNGTCVCPDGTPSGADKETCQCNIANCTQTSVNGSNECVCLGCGSEYVLSNDNQKCCPKVDKCSAYDNNCNCTQCVDTSGECLSFEIVGNVCVCVKCKDSACAKFCSPQVENCNTHKILEDGSCICEECNDDVLTGNTLVPSEDGKSCVIGCAAGLTAYEGSYYPAMYNSTTPTRYSDLYVDAALPTKVSGTHCCSNNPSASGQYDICCPAGSVMVRYYNGSVDNYSYSCGSQAFCDEVYGEGTMKWRKGLSGGYGWENYCYPITYKQYNCGALDGMGASFSGLGYWLAPHDDGDVLCADQS